MTPIHIEEFSNLNYTTSGLTILESHCSIQSGGYVKIGQLVIVNIRIKVDSFFSSSSFDLLNGLPPFVTGINCATFSTNISPLHAFLNGNKIQCGSMIAIEFNPPSSNAVIMINGVYITS